MINKTTTIIIIILAIIKGIYNYDTDGFMYCILACILASIMNNKR